MRSVLGNHEISNISHGTMSPSRLNHHVSMFSSIPKSSYSLISAFCTEDNIPHCISYVNQVLAHWLLIHCYLSSLLSSALMCVCASRTGAFVAWLLPMYRGQRARERGSEHGGSFKCHVRAAPDSQAEHEYLRGAGKRAPEEKQLFGTHADEQLKTQGMSCWA